ncbi:MAG: hypothetical protein N2254_07090 [bacterium]|nr:hypothetical protein [bacterium]
MTFQSCSARNKLFFHLSDKRYFVSYDKEIIFPSELSEYTISVETNFPNEVSIAISSGLFSSVKILPMNCYQEKNFVCSIKLQRKYVSGEENYFWFILRTEYGYYHVPNMMISPDLIDRIGKIYIQNK